MTRTCVNMFFVAIFFTCIQGILFEGCYSVHYNSNSFFIMSMIMIFAAGSGGFVCVECLVKIFSEQACM